MSEALQTAESHEAFLGDPRRGDGVFTYKAAVLADERESLPAEAFDRLRRGPLPLALTPREHGGQMGSFDELASVFKTLGRRDVALAMSSAAISWMAASNVMVAGSRRQREAFWNLVRDGRRLAVAFHERSNGNDLLASLVEARPDPAGFVLEGEKWLANNIHECDAFLLFAKTGPQGGPRGFSLFLIAKDDLDPPRFSLLPRVPTHGVRGCRIAGIRFEKCRIAADCMLGPPGSGLETALRAFQITRALTPAISLGAADTALRCALDFALSRRLYGRSVFDIEHARGLLTSCFLDLLICDCVLRPTARALHADPAMSGLRAAICKAFVGTVVEETLRKAALILGARWYLREGHWEGVFQKIARDVPLINVGHANTHVCLHTVALHMPRLLGAGQSDRRGPQDLSTIFDLERKLPSFEPLRLSLAPRKPDAIVRDARRLLEGLTDHSVANAVRSGVEQIERQLRPLGAATARLKDLRTPEKSREWLALAWRYCQLHAAACCLNVWVHNRSRGGFLAEGAWLGPALRRLLENDVETGNRDLEPLSDEMQRRHRDHWSFSAEPFRLGEAASDRTGSQHVA